MRKSVIGILALGLIATLGTAVVFLAAAGDTRLPEAAMKGDINSVRTLLTQKADVNAALGDGMTALHWAAFKDDVEMTQMLLKAGASVKATTRNGAITPLEIGRAHV